MSTLPSSSLVSSLTNQLRLSPTNPHEPPRASTMVNIYLKVDGPPLPFLNIPNSEVLRLSLRPYKNGSDIPCFLSAEPEAISLWHQTGQLSTMIPLCWQMLTSTIIPQVKVLFCDCLSLLAQIPCSSLSRALPLFVDHEGLNDQKTSSTQTDHENRFRQQIVRRDGACVVTQTPADGCDAAHLIAKSKGDEVRVLPIDVLPQ